MNRYILIRRLTGPAVLLLIGVLALLAQADVIRFWPLFWPLLFILIGVIKLAERAALASEGFPPPVYPVDPYAGYPNQPYPGAPMQSQAPVTGTSIVPAHRDDDVNGGR
ncbi:MAG TPA: hypothetical protein VGJ21_16660 [Terracidiphilus sp.]|jgi:hypothetical protein